MTTINDIRSVNWQVGLGGPGEVAENLADIRQCIGLIITTTKGTDPLRPEFGTNIYRLVDRPVNVAAPAIVQEILTGIQLWEPRVRVKSLVYTLQYERILFDLNLELLVNGDAALIIFEVDRLSRRPSDDFTGRAFSRGFSFAFS